MLCYVSTAYYLTTDLNVVFFVYDEMYAFKFFSFAVYRYVNGEDIQMVM